MELDWRLQEVEEVLAEGGPRVLHWWRVLVGAENWAVSCSLASARAAEVYWPAEALRAWSKQILHQDD